ncbi:hypothetical protein HCN44_005108 [Aphidius gifuensis]|uniref:Magnesium transporter NIPA2 n=1 Tax=Aphidius gifuensis TaxID=684658 RepID=A0A835CRF1_APHGI|nr:magnesium transporter NIPA2 [Aphidius gifuensis]KAF7992764.1 hypothetical protein HCN44_005108 [Aphidius gifuensis]
MEDFKATEFYSGLGLAIISNIFIGASFIIKKKALINLQKNGLRAGAGGHGYLKDCMWWAGFLSMGIGEAANFIAYALAPASIVTPLGALSIVVSAVLSSKYLNEKLNLLGKMGCFLCIIGSTMFILHAPKIEQHDTFDELIARVFNGGFIFYTMIILSICLFIVFYFGPVYGKENVIVYVFLCSIIGSLTVMCCKALGLALREMIYDGKNHMENFTIWILLFSTITFIMIQMNYLNKALDLFNTGIVTPIYYVFFTTSVIIASTILFQEWKTMIFQDILGTICSFLIVITAIFMLNAFKDIDISYNDLKSLSLPKRDNRRSNNNCVRRDYLGEEDKLFVTVDEQQDYSSSNNVRNT